MLYNTTQAFIDQPYDSKRVHSRNSWSLNVSPSEVHIQIVVEALQQSSETYVSHTGRYKCWQWKLFLSFLETKLYSFYILHS